MTTASTPSVTPLMFSDLMADLRRQGFTIGVDHYIRVQSLLLQLKSDCRPEDLAKLLCPIFATNAEQQELFYRIVEPYTESLIPFRESPQEANSPSRPTESKRRLTLKRTIPAFAVATILLAFIGWILLMSLSKSATDQPPRLRQAVLWIWRSVAASLCVALYLQFEYRYRRNRQLALERRRGTHPAWSWPVRSSSSSLWVFQAEEFHRLVRLLKTRETSEARQLDIIATVNTTIRGGGLPRLEYRQATRLSEYLFLIERRSVQDHQACYYSELIQALEREGVLLRYYYYDFDPRVCISENEIENIYAEELAAKFGDYRLVLIGNGQSCLDPISGRLTTWVPLFHRWSSRALLTPLAPDRWGSAERELSREFMLFPATLSGFLALAEQYEGPENQPVVEQSQISMLVGINTSSITYLKEYDSSVYRYLCACAVYPELQWELTKHLLTVPIVGESGLTERSFLTLMTLPWFREGVIPDESREQLIESMEPAAEEMVRTTIIELLENNRYPQESFAEQDRQWKIHVQRFLIDYRKFTIRSQVERVFLERHTGLNSDFTKIRLVRSSRVSRLFFLLPDRLKRLLFPDGLPLFGLRSSIRFVFLGIMIMAIGWIGSLRLMDLLANALLNPSVKNLSNIPWRILAPWILTLITAAVGFFVSLRQKRQLKIPRFYLAYFVVAGSIQLANAFVRSSRYEIVFWISVLLHKAILCMLSLEIISALLPSRFVKLWGIAFLAIMLVGVVNSIPTTAPETLLNLSTSASFTAAGLLLLLMFFEVNWTKEHAWITAGVLSVLASDFITSWRSTAPLSVISVSVIQLAPIPGLILLSLAGSSKLKD